MSLDDTLALDLPARLRLIAKGLLLFKWWFTIGSAVPDDFLANIKPVST